MPPASYADITFLIVNIEPSAFTDNWQDGTDGNSGSKALDTAPLNTPATPDDNSEPWYAAKMIFGWYRNSGKRECYEERIVLFRAISFEDAIEQAEKESERHCREWSSEDSQIRYEGFLDVYHLFEPTVGHGTEIYSKVRKSPLEPSEYLDRYYNDPEGEEDDQP